MYTKFDKNVLIIYAEKLYNRFPDPKFRQKLAMVEKY